MMTSSSGVLQNTALGSSSTMRRMMRSLTYWARGKLPTWARARADTDDLVQDAIVRLLNHLPRMKARQRHTISAFLRKTIRNRITDEVRRAGKIEQPAGEDMEHPSPDMGPLSQALSAERERLYRRALARLSTMEQTLIVGRLELAYSYEQLALATGKASPDAARVAVSRAVLKLIREMSG